LIKGERQIDSSTKTVAGNKKLEKSLHWKKKHYFCQTSENLQFLVNDLPPHYKDTLTVKWSALN
jgi:hypothetical protein